MISVLIVEDNVLLATTIERFLNDQGKMNVVAVAPSAEIALDMLPHTKVDLALVDVALPGMSGISLIALLSQQYPELPCLILSAHHEAEYIRRGLDAGAKGYVIKSDPLAILTAVNTVLAGEIYVSEELRKKLYH